MGYKDTSSVDFHKHVEDYAPIEPFDLEPLPIGQLRVQSWQDSNAYFIEVDNPPTQEAEFILLHVLPNVLQLFLEKNRDYSDGNIGSDPIKLGPKAQFVDIWRKVKKLKRGLWDGETLVGEQPDEIIKDLIGHSLLALGDYEREKRNAT